ncbi:U2 small nuclear ribo protein auxiliary factor 50 [Blyttiomyces helicus]|uniref:Splicing factor U2AF subunit n=1 Tax=Blyttiomyces helicus TaxID=388810 RepID=A0A4P9WCA6_9FUNG|nr:U2 small nuclear ribo protein auxiliary factor 50 [Blyttiomyces helicus]|eukprot:RKO89275.1 U2 small nuclear ribo protein auxiliary factor 50 [Blyttiomyces helicus]
MRSSQGGGGATGQNASIARQARRLYVGNIPYGVSEEMLLGFFNDNMNQIGASTSASPPVIAAQINHDKNYAFVEFRTAEESSAAMAFDGITFNGQSLKIRRPKDYQPPVGYSSLAPTIHVPGVVSTNVPDSPNKIFVGGLPIYLNDEQVLELLKSFGELRAFNLVKEPITGQSKGFAFCEYVDPSLTDIACQGLNGMELGDKKLVVQRASVGAGKLGMPSVMPPMSMGLSMPLPIGIIGAPVLGEETRVLLLLNMVTPEELANDDDYQDILEDIKDECGKFGTVSDVVIPRPPSPSVGKIFVRFANPDQCGVALRALAGRKFAERTVVTAYYSEQKFEAQEY